MPIVSPLRDEFIQSRSRMDTQNNAGASQGAEKEETAQDSLRVVTYNILADLYVSREASTTTSTAANDSASTSAPTPTTTYPHITNYNLFKTKIVVYQ